MDRMMDDRHSSRKNKQMMDCLQTKAISHRPAQHNSIIINLTNNTPEKTERSAVQIDSKYTQSSAESEYKRKPPTPNTNCQPRIVSALENWTDFHRLSPQKHGRAAWKPAGWVEGGLGEPYYSFSGPGFLTKTACIFQARTIRTISQHDTTTGHPGIVE